MSETKKMKAYIRNENNKKVYEEKKISKAFNVSYQDHSDVE